MDQLPAHCSAPIGAAPVPGRRRSLAACLLVPLLVLAAPAAAREWFVSTTGSDAGDGSRARPFRTIGHVLAPGNYLVEAGDTVTLLAPPGNRTYRECDVRLRVRLELRSEPGARAHIHCDIVERTPPSAIRQALGCQGVHPAVSAGEFIPPDPLRYNRSRRNPSR